jgi:REP element-mobilizing transposase RayT
MVRPLRLEFPGTCYNLTARGDRQEPIFEDDADRLVFLDLLAKEVLQQGWVLYAFCLMGNHYHLLVEAPEANLVQGLRRLNEVYTPAFNRSHVEGGGCQACALREKRSRCYAENDRSKPRKGGDCLYL